MSNSTSIENYIKTIYSLGSGGQQWVSTNELAEKLSIKPSSVTDMLKKLGKKDLVEYAKYKGVKLNKQGSELALEVIRKHRLWEVFLAEKLGYSWDEVHDIAEQLEHVSSDSLIDRLDEFLDHPRFDPHGDPIPDSDGRILKEKRKLLSKFEEGEEGSLAGVADSSSVAFLQYLESNQLAIGTGMKILNKFDYDGSMEVLIEERVGSLNLSKEVCENLYLNKK